MDLANRDSYEHWTSVTIRYCDQDSMGHVNNAIYAEWLEASRVMLIDELFKGHTRLSTVLARMTIDYLNETHFPGTVEVGGRLTRVGNKSFDSGYGVFRGGVCLATATCVNVFFDLETRRSAVPPEALKAILRSKVEP
ncbi:MAG: acyl-CoA thioesterase [Gammaproteobacteria bacterium]